MAKLLSKSQRQQTTPKTAVHWAWAWCHRAKTPLADKTRRQMSYTLHTDSLVTTAQCVSTRQRQIGRVSDMAAVILSGSGPVWHITDSLLLQPQGLGPTPSVGSIQQHPVVAVKRGLQCATIIVRPCTYTYSISRPVLFTGYSHTCEGSGILCLSWNALLPFGVWNFMHVVECFSSSIRDLELEFCVCRGMLFFFL